MHLRFSCCSSQRSDTLSQAFQPVKFGRVVHSITTLCSAGKVCSRTGALRSAVCDSIKSHAVFSATVGYFITGPRACQIWPTSFSSAGWRRSLSGDPPEALRGGCVTVGGDVSRLVLPRFVMLAASQGRPLLAAVSRATISYFITALLRCQISPSRFINSPLSGDRVSVRTPLKPPAVKPPPAIQLAVASA
jgi:hypothetical protein